MARQIKISDGDLFAKGKTQVVCVTGAWDFGDIDYVIIKGKKKGNDGCEDRADFLKKYPTRIDKIVIQ